MFVLRESFFRRYFFKVRVLFFCFDMSVSKHREAFQDFAEEAEEELGSSLSRLYLYGSVARDDESEFSDVDVFAVVEDEGCIDELYDLAARVGRRHGVHLAVVARTSDEFERTKDSFFTRQVIETGEAAI